MDHDYPNAPTRPIPTYRSHKIVGGLQIASIGPLERGRGHLLTPTRTDYEPFYVDIVYIKRNSPQVGGYYVEYDDGYKSYSPQQPFENGYTLIEAP